MNPTDKNFNQKLKAIGFFFSFLYNLINKRIEWQVNPYLACRSYAGYLNPTHEHTSLSGKQAVSTCTPWQTLPWQDGACCSTVEGKSLLPWHNQQQLKWYFLMWHNQTTQTLYFIVAFNHWVSVSYLCLCCCFGEYCQSFWHLIFLCWSFPA